MKVLLDHCVPRPFRRLLPLHDVRTTAQMSWEQLQNGRLLAAAAAAEFDVVLTVDKKIKREQNLHSLPIAVVILDAMRNTPDALAPFAPLVEPLLSSLKRGQMLEVHPHGSVIELAPGR